MTRLRILRAAAPLTLAGALAIGLAAAAQTPPPGGPGPGPGAGMAAHREMREHRREGMAKHHAEMIADWTTVLHLSPSQAQALSAAMAPPGPPPAPPAGDKASESTLQRMDAMQARVAEREGRMKAHLAAMRGFYLSLSPEQQKTFDAVTRLSHHGMGRGGHHMGTMGGPMGGPRGPGHMPPPPPGE